MQIGFRHLYEALRILRRHWLGVGGSIAVYAPLEAGLNKWWLWSESVSNLQVDRVLWFLCLPAAALVNSLVLQGVARPARLGAIGAAALRLAHGYLVTGLVASALAAFGWVLAFATGRLLGIANPLWVIPWLMPSVIYLVRSVLTDAIIVCEGKGQGEARRRSQRLMRGCELHVFLVAGLALAPAYALDANTDRLVRVLDPYTPFLPGAMAAFFGVISTLLLLPAILFLYVVYVEINEFQRAS